MKKFFSPLRHFIDLLYPQTCEACEKPLVEGEQVLCTYCRYEMPLTNFWSYTDNPAAKLFWGKTKLEQASSFFYYAKESRYRQLMHKLKYKGRQEIGVHLGRLYGNYLVNSMPYSSVDAIVPLPLHAKRLAKRGYNQSERIADGISATMQKPMLLNTLIRNVYTETQTNKNRIDRWKNVENVFSVALPEVLYNKHILLVDDILTTGATLEACANTIQQATHCKVSIATLAYAVY